jgi:hypothetical protein
LWLVFALEQKDPDMQIDHVMMSWFIGYCFMGEVIQCTYDSKIILFSIELVKIKSHHHGASILIMFLWPNEPPGYGRWGSPKACDATSGDPASPGNHQIYTPFIHRYWKSFAQLMAQTYDLLLTCVDGDAIDVGDDVGQETTDHVWCGWQAALYIYLCSAISPARHKPLLLIESQFVTRPVTKDPPLASVRNTTRDKRVTPFSLGLCYEPVCVTNRD